MALLLVIKADRLYLPTDRHTVNLIRPYVIVATVTAEYPATFENNHPCTTGWSACVVKLHCPQCF